MTTESHDPRLVPVWKLIQTMERIYGELHPMCSNARAALSQYEQRFSTEAERAPFEGIK